MKKLLILFFALLLFTGCATMQQPTTKTTPDLNEGRSAGIGDVFFEYVMVTPVDPMSVAFGVTPPQNDVRFDLTILELNDQKIGLQYSEYLYRYPQTIGYTTIPGGWMIKEGFNKRFDYAVVDKTIRFKGYEFEIVSVEKGQIKYKRIK